MKFDHSSDYVYKFDGDTFDIEYDFTSDLGTGDSVASATVTCTDSDGNDTTSSMISGVAVSSPDVTFTLSGGTVGKLYSIKILATSTNSKIYSGFLTLEVFGAITINSKLGDSNANSYVTLTQANEYIMNKYGHVNAWDTLTIEGKKRVLIEAARIIDENNFYGDKYYDSQSMEFPRDDHEVIEGDCATPFTLKSFSNSNLYSDTYGEYPENYWKYGSCHITAGTPAREVALIASSSATNGLVTMNANFSATPTANSDFIIFTPVDKLVRHAQCEQALHILQTSSMYTVTNYKNVGAERVKIGDVEVLFNDNISNNSYTQVAPSAKQLLSKFTQKSFRVYRE